MDLKAFVVVLLSILLFPISFSSLFRRHPREHVVVSYKIMEFLGKSLAQYTTANDVDLKSTYIHAHMD